MQRHPHPHRTDLQNNVNIRVAYSSGYVAKQRDLNKNSTNAQRIGSSDCFLRGLNPYLTPVKEA